MTKKAAFESKKFANDIINNDTMTDDEVVASDVPPRYLFCFGPKIRLTNNTSWSMHRSTRDSKSLEGLFGIGSCFGIDSSTHVEVPLAFWHYTILARHNCRVFYLDGRLMQVRCHHQL